MRALVRSDGNAGRARERLSARVCLAGSFVRDSNTLILNTRSAQALTRGGIPRGSWDVINRTGDPLYEGLLSGQLGRNGLTSSGYDLPP